MKEKNDSQAVHDEILKMILNDIPIATVIVNSDISIIDCNQEALDLFCIPTKKEFSKQFFNLSPLYQPDGSLSIEKAEKKIREAFNLGMVKCEWMYQTLNGELMPCKLTMVRKHMDGQAVIVIYTHIFAMFEDSYAKMQEADARMRIMLDATPLSCYFRDHNFTLIDCNEEAVKLLGFSSKADLIKNWDKSVPEFQPDGSNSLEKARAMRKEGFEKGTKRFEWLHQNLNGELIPCEITFVKVLYKNGDALAVYVRDLREYQALKAAKEEADERMRVMLEVAPLCCIIIGENFRLLECNENGISLFGFVDKSQAKDYFLDFLSPYQQPDGSISLIQLRKRILEVRTQGHITFEWIHQTLTGEPIPCEVTLVHIQLKGEDMYLGYVRDLRKLKSTIDLMNQLEKLATIDSLTGTYNRRYGFELAESILLDAEHQEADFAAIMFDLDKFKKINDTYGHLAGDEVLREVAHIVQSKLRQGNIFTRYGGEEFIVFLPQTNLKNAMALAEELRCAIGNNICYFNEIPMKITVSLGVVVAKHPMALSDIVFKADRALYKAKENGRNRIEGSQ